MTRRQLLQRTATALVITKAAKQVYPESSIIVGIDAGSGSDRTCITYGRWENAVLHVTGYKFL